MTIYFLRHASAGEQLPNPVRDLKRPLDKHGISQSHQVGRFLAALDVQIDALFSSGLKRATQTASLVGNELAFEGKLQLVPALKPGATFSQFKELLQANAHYESVMVVGHNPTISEFLGLLLSNGKTSACADLPKGGVAKVEVERKMPAVLKWCVTPKVLEALHTSSAASPTPKSSRK